MEDDPITKSLFLSTLPARGATGGVYYVAEAKGFLSTLPARGATWHTTEGCKIIIDISIHAPREGSDRAGQANQLGPIGISIHAPREGSDGFRDVYPFPQLISIHAPREGSDPPPTRPRRPLPNFYPRSPRGERRVLRRLQRRL